MRMHRPIDATLHGITDYAVGATLMSVFPRLVGLSDTPAGRQIRVAGAVHAGYSTMTAYPLGAVKAIPYRVHLALDAVGALALAAAPFVTGDFRKGRRHWVPQAALCAFELTALLLTDPTGRGDYHGDVERVREANAEDPGRKIREGGPAIAAANAFSPP